MYTTRLYYGRISLSHYDRDHVRVLGDIINRALAEAGETVPVHVDWVQHVDGVDTVDSRWNGKKWIAAQPAKKRR
jgi:hypothetical protein